MPLTASGGYGGARRLLTGVQGAAVQQQPTRLAGGGHTILRSQDGTFSAPYEKSRLPDYRGAPCGYFNPLTEVVILTIPPEPQTEN